MIAEVLAQAIKELIGDQPALLIGHSAGGFAALSIAAYHPQMAAGLIIFIGWYRLLQKSKRLSHILWRTFAANAPAMYRSMQEGFPHMFRFFTQLNRDNMVHYFANMLDIDITDQLSKIDSPVLAIAGKKDPFVPPS